MKKLWLVPFLLLPFTLIPLAQLAERTPRTEHPIISVYISSGFPRTTEVSAVVINGILFRPVTRAGVKAGEDADIQIFLEEPK